MSAKSQRPSNVSMASVCQGGVASTGRFCWVFFLPSNGWVALTAARIGEARISGHDQLTNEMETPGDVGRSLHPHRWRCSWSGSRENPRTPWRRLRRGTARRSSWSVCCGRTFLMVLRRLACDVVRIHRALLHCASAAASLRADDPATCDCLRRNSNSRSHRRIQWWQACPAGWH